MKIALTHEQADFDAIASLAGVHLLQGDITPVLPRRYNRNVREFLSLYQGELSFIEAHALPPDPIDAITLVDTQSLVTLKRMTKNASVRVIDHHNLRQNLPADWEVSIDDLGACTTILVESIQEKNLNINVIQATLLLLGIYEDTGSLTYVRTNSRDVRAAAFLMEHGASLRIANDYLYPPLSDEQRQLYDQLLTNIEAYQIRGQEIIIAKAFAEEMTDEVSSAAHKLRDLLDPDALILIINTSDGIRLVARSTTDRVDVAALAEHFGGGGHQRASAALLRHDDDDVTSDRSASVQETIDAIIEILPQFIQPAITVEDIMSKGALVLHPTQMANEAASLMRKYGYEGFPVVDGNRVLGLLTRRIVDRALAHKLNPPVSSLMEAGHVTIQPNATLEELQTLMNSSGWGQIPVVDSQTQAIIGIVTRTDLIKTLTRDQAQRVIKQNLSDKLEKALPAAHLALLKKISQHASERDLPLYIVGGFVRDLLLDRPSLDFDLVTEGNAILFAQSLAERYGGKVISHRRFGTAKWRIAEIRESLFRQLSSAHEFEPASLPAALDLISARTEFYDRPTVLPVVERSSIKLDLHRRDFSINTMALRLDNQHYAELHDYWGGLNDLKHGYVRVLHSLSFVDDPTRLLRAVRFEQRFHFRIEDRTLQLMQEAHGLLRQVSGDRIRHELDAILTEEDVLAMLNRLQSLDLFRSIHPELHWSLEISAQVEKILCTSASESWKLPLLVGNNSLKQALIYLTWFRTLKIEKARAIARRLRFSKRLSTLIGEIYWLEGKLEGLASDRPSSYVAIFDEVSRLSLFIVNMTTLKDEIRLAIQTFLTYWQNLKPRIGGTDLMEMGIKPGPAYRHILGKLRNAWLDGLIQNSAEEMQLFEQLVKEHLPPETRG